jgi:tRNA threonylcarbamoyladenosine biosynthesis protein TsaB
VRVGLTAVKAWSEVFGKPIVGISRLEAVARRAGSEQGWVAASYDAQRGQIFGALYRRNEGSLERVEDELVVAADLFLAMVDERAGGKPVEWVTLDPQIFMKLEGWPKRERIGDLLETCEGDLASTIAEMAEERAARDDFTDVLQLDANYVRRSDAEIFWKGNSPSGKG